MSNLPHEPNLSFRVSCFNDILISAATTHVKRSKPSKRSKLWMTPHVRAKIRNQNRLCQTIRHNRQERIDACCEANEAINEAKAESWENLLQVAMSSSDGPNMWKVIKALTVLLVLTLLTKLCPTTIEPSLILNPKLGSSSTTTPGSANSICHSLNVAPTSSSRNVLKHHL